MNPANTDYLPWRTTVGVLVALLAVTAPHAANLPPWVVAVTACCGLWRAVIARRGTRLPPRWLRLALMLLAVAGVLLAFGTVAGRDAGVSLLMLMTGLKALEAGNRRDTLVLLHLAMFLVATQFLFSQAIPMALYLLAAVTVLLTVLITVTRPTGEGRLRSNLRTASVLTAQALPIMAVLFVLFPRLPGPLWSMPESGGSARTGLSDTLSPGDISQLSRSDALAFSVTFDGPVPPAEQMYWRGPVLAAYDGRAWRRLELAGPATNYATRGEPVDYTVVVEPHRQRWLFGLDLPTGDVRRARYSPWQELMATSPVRNERRYRLRSYPEYTLEPTLTARQRRFYTYVPEDAHPRARTLAAKLEDATNSPRGLVRAGLDWLRERPFVYTLTPPRLPGDVVDGFLFGTREGFCEHFAGAFAALMRLAGQPARVVTGYLGAERIAGKDFVVRQSDAHAWVEVWLPGAGWRRFDPTTTVAPERIEGGLGGALDASEPVPLMARPGDALLKDLRRLWEHANIQWDRWVLGYGPRLQAGLLDALGFAGHWAAASALGIALALALTLLAVSAGFGGKRPRPAPEQRLWERACRRLARRGLPRHPSEGPRAYATRVARSAGDSGIRFGEIARLYIALRYGAGGDTELQRLRRRVAAFHPRRG